MKKLIPFITCLLLSVVVFAQEGVNFQHLTFDEALAKAKAEKKLVFVDCYTTWCGPCKYMAEKVFPLKESGDYFNSRFVSVKYDMDQEEGKSLKGKLKVKAYPSFFIIRPDGTIQHSIVGGGGTFAEFAKRVDRGLNEKTSLLYLSNLYEKGKINKKQLMDYQVALSEAYDDENAQKIGKELSAQLTEKDKLKKEFWPLFEQESCKVGSPDFNLLLANLSVFEKNIGKEKLENYLNGAYNQALSPHLSGRAKENTISLDELKQQIAKLNIEGKDLLVKKVELAELVKTGNTAGVIAEMEAKAEALEGRELGAVLSAFYAVGPKATKDEAKRAAVALEKARNNPKNKMMEENLYRLAQHYESIAHVGTYFQELTFEQALEKARKTGRRLLIDCYTTWCGPCKFMTEKIFPQEEMGDYLNSKFICVKYDMEKGEGIDLKKRFGIRAYPTFVILNPDGTVWHKLIGGGQKPEDFIKRVTEALDPSKAFGPLNKKYEAGERGKEFLLQYFNALEEVRSNEMNKVAEELYKQLTDEEKVSEKYWTLFKNDKLSIHAEARQYLLTNREKFNQSLGEETVEKFLGSKFKGQLALIFRGRDNGTTAADIDQMKKEVVDLKLKNEKLLLAELNIAKATISKNVNQIISVCEKESVNIPADEFPYTLTMQVKEKGTPAQLTRWVKLCKKMAAACKDQKMMEQLNDFLDKVVSGK